jgi:prepilin-type N-terminal cleavage/methylation domain-containing protein
MAADRLARPSLGALDDERGYTLLEVLLVAAVLAVVLGALLAFLGTNQKLAHKDSERSSVIRETQVGLDRMTRELRHAYQVVSNTAYALEVRAVVQGRDRHVRYSCDEAHPTEPLWRRCVRYEIGAGGPGAGQLVVDRVLNLAPAGGSATPRPVFTYSPDAATATYVKVRVEVPAKGALREGHENSIVFDDGFYMRNRDLG